MPFPESARVIYGKNPLEEVICQVKFPPILKIDAELPSAFQDEIRSQYPLLQEVPAVALNLPAEIASMIPGLTGAKSYLFESSDHFWKATLNREFLSLSTTKYSRWEEFRTRLEAITGSLERIYRPAFFVRIGLRYRNKIKRSILKLDGVEWSQLLQPWILGELSQPEVAPHVQQAVRDVLMSLNRGGKSRLRLRHGTVPVGSEEGTYSIDGDFFIEEATEIKHVIERLNALNREAGNLFRWCITDRLHDRLEPTPIK